MRSRWMRLVAAGAVLAAALVCSQVTPAAAGARSAPPLQLNSKSIVPRVLTAGSADKPSTLTWMIGQPDAYFWINNFNSSNDYLSWTVTADAATEFNVTALLSSTSETPFTLTNSASGSTTAAISHAYGWDRLPLGTIAVPKGTSTLTLRRSTSTTAETDVKSIELIPATTQSKYDADVAKSKANSQWLTDAGYGLFFQYGAWGYPKTGPAKSLDDQACDFDVPKFVKMVQSTGAAYVMWSYTWYTYQVDGPNPAIDKILGNGGNTANCDLNLKVAKALQQVGIKFMLYYHNGHDQDPAWWAKQNFPANYKYTGTGDKSTFDKNWKNVISWIGNHYGKLLDGFWFDDGQYYYPDNFSELQRTARAGNPNRIVTFNSWISSAYTQYQDYQPGENCDGSPRTGSPTGPDGVYLSGPFKGIRAQCLVSLNQDWGVHDPNTTIKSTTDIFKLMKTMDTALANHTTLSLNLMMYENGDVDPATLELLQQVKSIYRDGAPRPTPPPPDRNIVNNDNSQLTYTGAWRVSSGRGAGDYKDDLNYTVTKGDSASITFTGTGIDYYAPKYAAGQYATAQVKLDGVDQGNHAAVSADGSYQPQQLIYGVQGLASGQHTLTVTNVGDAAYFQVDYFKVVP